MKNVLLILVLTSTPALAQPAFSRGDVIVSSARINENGMDFDSTLTVVRNDGTIARTLVATPWRLLTDVFVTDNIVYVGARSPQRIDRVTAAGTFLPPFATNVVNINYLSPGPGNGLVAMNVSGEIYHSPVMERSFGTAMFSRNHRAPAESISPVTSARSSTPWPIPSRSGTPARTRLQASSRLASLVL